MVHQDYASLVAYISSVRPEAVVVEGYDGVGKGSLIKELYRTFSSSCVYRPNYEFWVGHNLPREYRWMISASYWDIMTSTRSELRNSQFIIFDRGVLSGAVYNEDDTIAEDYAELIKNRSVLHILVTCDESDFLSFQLVRNSTEFLRWENCLAYTNKYLELLESNNLSYTVYKNKYNHSFAKSATYTCLGCGHYDAALNVCRNAKVNKIVTPSSRRCEFSRERELQDEQVCSV